MCIQLMYLAHSLRDLERLYSAALDSKGKALFALDCHYCQPALY
jgi:hypothetical protein